MAKVAKLPKNRVWPSGAARAANSAAAVPPAPSRLSTTTGWPNRAASLVAISRAAMSSTLPGPPGTTQVILCLGKSSAPAGACHTQGRPGAECRPAGYHHAAFRPYP